MQTFSQRTLQHLLLPGMAVPGTDRTRESSRRRSGVCITCLYKCASIIIYIVLCNSLGKKGAVGRQGAVKCNEGIVAEGEN